MIQNVPGVMLRQESSPIASGMLEVHGEVESRSLTQPSGGAHSDSTPCTLPFRTHRSRPDLRGVIPQPEEAARDAIAVEVGRFDAVSMQPSWPCAGS
ncbi:MAG: hypothetical protein RIT25_665 [Planctomycetota bacterium]